MTAMTERDRRRDEQLPLAFPYDAATGRDDLLVSGRLSAAVSIVDEWPHWPSPVVILAGPVRTGKSPLAAIWRAKAGAADIPPAAGSGGGGLAAARPDARRVGREC